MTITQSNILVSPAFAAVSEILDDCAYVVISSTDKYDNLSARDNCLVLHFEDTELEDKPSAISGYDIFRIIRFIRGVEAEDLFICCDAGESRSPAVAAGLLRRFGFSDNFIWESDEYRPNVLVYRRFLEFTGGFEEIVEHIRMISPEEYRRYRKPEKLQSPSRDFYEPEDFIPEYRIDPMKDTIGFDVPGSDAFFIPDDMSEGWDTFD